MPKQYPREIRDRAIRLVIEHRSNYESQTDAIRVLAERLDIGRESLRRWVVQADIDAGARDGTKTAEQERIRQLEREVKELRRTNDTCLDMAIWARGHAAHPTKDGLIPHWDAGSQGGIDASRTLNS
jgi:transposase